MVLIQACSAAQSSIWSDPQLRCNRHALVLRLARHRIRCSRPAAVWQQKQRNANYTQRGRTHKCQTQMWRCFSGFCWKILSCSVPLTACWWCKEDELTLQCRNRPAAPSLVPLMVSAICINSATAAVQITASRTSHSLQRLRIRESQRKLCPQISPFSSTITGKKRWGSCDVHPSLLVCVNAKAGHWWGKAGRISEI